MKHLYWLDDAAWGKIEPHLPRGRRGAHRVDDRRVISGIIHMLRTGARWRDCPAAYGPYTTIYNRYHRWSQQGVWFDVFQALTGMSGVWGGWGNRRHPHQGSPFGGGGKRGAFAQAIGRSRGGPTTKIHALTDDAGRPRVLRLSAGNVNDGTMAATLITAVGPISHLLADRAYDANALRACLAERGTLAVIPSTRSRTVPIPPRPRPLPPAQPHRAHVLPAQGLATHRNPIRQTRTKLRCSRPHRRNRSLLAKLSPDPSACGSVTQRTREAASSGSGPSASDATGCQGRRRKCRLPLVRPHRVRQTKRRYEGWAIGSAEALRAPKGLRA